MDEHNPNLGHLMMFVMEHLNGMMVYEGDLSKWLPTTYLEKVENILMLLHENGLVFGDLHSLNVMIMKDNKVKFIDIDWAGKKQGTGYPLNMLQTIMWLTGAEPLAVIVKSHYIKMLKRLPKVVSVL